MGLVSPTQVSDGSTADSSDINTPINQIAAVVNGNIDNSNIAAAAAIDGSKLANNSIDVGAKASVFDGWIAVSDTWTYASATTVTVPSDATTKYSVGDKVKFTNSGAKYFYITAVGATTLTLNGGSDYTVANAAITVPYYSKSTTPLAFPQWFNYTPTWTNLTVSGSTVAARFAMHGKTVIFRTKVTLGGGNVPSGSVSFTTPTTIASGYSAGTAFGQAYYEDTGTSQTVGKVEYGTTTTAVLIVDVASGTYLSRAALSSTVPHVWANTDIISSVGTYEAA